MPIRALILEDDPSWGQILREILTDTGLEVDIVGNLPDALQLVSQKSHRLAVVDLSLSDSDPHNQDGLVFLHALRQHDPGCVAILLTGYATVEIAVRALTDMGVYTCLRKEIFQREEFKTFVHQALSIPAGHIQHNYLLAKDTANNEPERAGLEGSEELRALLVEDDAGWREILLELLREAGFTVHSCASFGEALGWMRRETFHLVVIDLALDGAYTTHPLGRMDADQDLGGFRLLESMHSMQTPVIVVSGAATVDEIERAYRDYEIFAFVEKQTFDRRVFLQTLTEATQSSADFSLLKVLTNREKEVLELLARGLTNKEIARALVITPNTVKRHLKAIFEKLDIHTRSAAASMAASWFGSIRSEDQLDSL